MNKAVFIPGKPEVTRTVVESAAVPPKVQLELSVEAAAWLLAIAGKHNGDSTTNPINGLYYALDAFPAVSARAQSMHERLRRVSLNMKEGYTTFDVYAIQ